MKTIIRYTLLTALRDLLFIGLMAMVLMAYGLSVFVGSTALVEESSTTLAYFAGASRFVLVIGLVVFVCFHVRRAFDNREIESILSKPVSRVEFVVAYWLGFVLLAFLAILPVLLVIYFLNNADFVGMLYWGASMFLEISLIIAFALVASLMMKSAVSSVLSCMAFYLISRLMGFFVAAMSQKASFMGEGMVGEIMTYGLKGISTVIPRLDMFAKSSWLIYGVEKQSDLWIFQAQSVVYIAFLLAMATFDFKRKQF